VILLLLAGFYLLPRSQSPAHDLALRVEPQDHGYRVTWDRSRPIVRSASQATLRIDDSSETVVLLLSPSQLADGSFVYLTDAPDLTFRMRVDGSQGGRSAESVHVLSRHQPPPAPAAQKSGPEPALAVAQPAATTEPADSGEPVIPVIMFRPVPPTNLAEFSPARPLRRFTPDADASHVTGTQVVEVEVRINDDGKVTEAHPLNAGAKTPYLTAMAVKASLQWTFEPARSQGRVVPSGYRISYRFSPN
jgi:hypothetical protein